MIPAGITLEIAISSQKIRFITEEKMLPLNSEFRTKEKLYNIFEQIKN
jgi:hypothetical protein